MEWTVCYRSKVDGNEHIHLLLRKIVEVASRTNATSTMTEKQSVMHPNP